MEHSTPDLDRERRQGLPEVVYGPGKTPAEITDVVRALLAGSDGPVLATRVTAEVAAQVDVPGAVFDEAARLLRSEERRVGKECLL